VGAGCAVGVGVGVLKRAGSAHWGRVFNGSVVWVWVWVCGVGLVS